MVLHEVLDRIDLLGTLSVIAGAVLIAVFGYVPESSNPSCFVLFFSVFFKKKIIRCRL